MSTSTPQFDTKRAVKPTNRREFFRVPLDGHPSTLTITLMKGNEIITRKADIFLEDIGPGGLCFLSDLVFPENHRVVYGFDVDFQGQRFNLAGLIVRRNLTSHDRHSYGVRFLIDEEVRRSLVQNLNEYMIKLRKKRA